MKRNTFILKCFLQFICTNLDGSQKEGDNFLNLLQKEGGNQKEGGSLRKGGGFPTLEKTMHVDTGDDQNMSINMRKKEIMEL